MLNLIKKIVKSFEDSAYYIIGFGWTIILISVIFFLFEGYKNGFSFNLNSDLLDHFGSFIGGLVGALFSLASVLLVLETLEKQEKIIKNQAIDLKRQKVNDQFYELLKIHRENCSEMLVYGQQGRKVFIDLYIEVCQSLNTIQKINLNYNLNLKQEDEINIAYLCFYFGAIGKNSINALKPYIEEYGDSLTANIEKEYTSANKELKDKNNDYFFDGHQVRLGHYFRHLYQIVRFINDQDSKIITYQEKYQYIRILRAQLSNHEQVIFFFNSLSKLGKSWEREKGLSLNDQLVTKYNFITNIPKDFINTDNVTIDIESYYPSIVFEYQYQNTNKIKLRNEWEKQYN